MKALYNLNYRNTDIKLSLFRKGERILGGFPVSFQHVNNHLRCLGALTVMLLLTTLVACQTGEYPVDHEQLSSEDRIVIRFSHIVGENTPKGLAARKFAKLIRERSNGLVEVQVFPNGYLYKDGEEMEALLNGDIQMVAPATSKVTKVVPEFQVLDLPFAFRNSDEVHEYLSSELGKKALAQLQTKGYYPLSIWDNGFKQMTNNQHELKRPEDFSGLRFRIMPSEVIKNQFITLNASTQSNSFNEVFQLLEDKAIDGQENTFSNIVSKEIHSLQQFLTISNHGYLGYVVLMNKQFLDGLPIDIQRLIKETMKEVTAWEIKLSKELNEQNLNDLQTCNCMEIHSLTDQERQLWEDALQPVYTHFVDRFGAEYIEQLPRFKEVNHSK